MSTEPYTDDEYRTEFLSDMDKNTKALKQALDIRKFEIELYWKRAAYFWTFIAATFAGFVAIQVSNSEDKIDMSILLSCLGIVFSFAWFCVNRGSKYWQENWEYHVDMLEDKITGPLYKVVMTRSDPSGVIETIKHLITGPSPLSVSKINQIISLFITIMWMILLVNSLPPFRPDANLNYFYVTIISITILTCVGFLAMGRTFQGGYWHMSTKRTAKINIESNNSDEWKLGPISILYWFIQIFFNNNKLTEFATCHDFETELLTNEQLKKGIEETKIEKNDYIKELNVLVIKRTWIVKTKFIKVLVGIVGLLVTVYWSFAFFDILQIPLDIKNILRLLSVIVLMQATLGKVGNEIESFMQRTVIEQINHAWPRLFYIMGSLLLFTSFLLPYYDM